LKKIKTHFKKKRRRYLQQKIRTQNMKNFKILNASVDPTGSSSASGASGANNVSGDSQNTNNIAGNAAFTKELQETISRIEILMDALVTENVAKQSISKDQNVESDQPSMPQNITFDPSQSSDLWKRLTGG
jgi:fructose-1,6-bisphosphatase